MRKILLVLLSIACIESSNAQKKVDGSKVFTKENAFIGGNGTLNFFNGIFLVGINPMYGYFVKDWLDVATVLNLQYNNFDVSSQTLQNGSYKKTFMVGTGISSRIYPVDFLYIQVQPEINLLTGNEKYFTGAGQVSQRFTKLVPSILTGVGMKRGFQKGRTFAYISVLFDVLANENSPYRSFTGNTVGGIASITSGNVIPILRFGFNMSLADLGKKNN